MTAPRPFAPLWARVMIGAGLIALVTQGLALVPDREIATDLVPVFLAPVLALVLASSEPRLTRRAVYAYGLAWLAPLVVSLALGAPGGPMERFFRMTLFFFGGLLCSGGVAAVRGMQRAGASPADRALRGTIRFVVGGIGLVVISAVLLLPIPLAVTAARGLRIGPAAVEMLALLAFVAQVALAHEVVSWLARGRPGDGSGLARTSAGIARAFSMREPGRT